MYVSYKQNVLPHPSICPKLVLDPSILFWTCLNCFEFITLKHNSMNAYINGITFRQFWKIFFQSPWSTQFWFISFFSHNLDYNSTHFQLYLYSIVHLLSKYSSTCIGLPDVDQADSKKISQNFRIKKILTDFSLFYKWNFFDCF